MNLNTLKDFGEEECSSSTEFELLEELKQEAIKELKIIDDLSFKAPELLTNLEKMLIKSEKYIKWKFNITDEDLK